MSLAATDLRQRAAGKCAVTFGSVCSGIEAATVAWAPLGWRPLWVAEIDTFPCALLKHYYPEVPNYGDFTKIRDAKRPDVLVGGTPCQSFSVAGKRGGLDDARGVLAFEFLALAGRLRPTWIVFENVPGLLSSDEGRDFGAFIGALGKLGYGWAYRILDAQFFGLAQRRERLFVVGYLGDWRPPVAVLFESESLRRDSPPSREAGESFAHELAPCIGASGRGFERTGETRGQDPVVSFALNAHGVRSHPRPGSNSVGLVVPFDTTQITSVANFSNPKSGDPCHPLANGAHPPAIAFNLRGREGGAMPEAAEVASVRAASGGSSRSYVASTLGGRMRGQDDACANNVQATHMGVRRLTPRECERLQGFPDDYTAIPYRNKPAADGPRYKALGNSMAVPVIRWIGQRIAAHFDVTSGKKVQGQ